MLVSSHISAPDRRLIPTLSLVLLLLAAGFAFGAQPVLAQDAPPAAPSAYLVQFQPEMDEAARAAWIARQGAELVSWLPQINVAELRPLNAAASNLTGSLTGSLTVAAADMASIVYIEPDGPVSGDYAVSDPAFGNANQSYGQQMLRVSAAWDITPGDDDIIIAIVDSGIDPSHPEFRGRLAPGYDFVNNDNDASDDHGHGTHVAGIAAAGLNGVGTVGVCPQCKLMPVKVLNARNGGTWSLVAKGILYAVDHGARVINLSLGATESKKLLEDAIRYAQEHGVVVVAAAGNTGSDIPFYPAAIPYVVAVGGTDRNDARWAQSNYGGYVDVMAPAVSIYSAYHDPAGSATYAYMSGTSMASPFVSGLAGLTFSRDPKLTAAEVIQLITEEAIDLGAPGKDTEYGYGRIDVYATLLAANGGVAPTPQNPPDDGSGGSSAPVAHLYLPAIVAH